MKNSILMGSILFLTPLLGTPMTAFASSEETLKEVCIPIEKLLKIQRKSEKIKASKRDTLELETSAQFQKRDDNRPFPKFYSKEGGVVQPFTVLPSGEVVDFNNRLNALSKDGAVCAEVPVIDGKKSKIGFNIGADIRFKNQTGPYTLAELQDGVADGKTWYKVMFPGPLSIMVPKMTHLMVEYDGTVLSADGIQFSKLGAALPNPLIEEFGGTYVIALKAIEASGADLMSVSGGPFTLSPVPSIEKMKSLGFGTDGNDADEKDVKPSNDKSDD